MRIGGETIRDVRCKYRNGELSYYETLKAIINYPTENMEWIDNAITDLREDYRAHKSGEEFSEN